MDKLDLDARVARLERHVGWLSTAILAFLALIGVGLVLALTARMEARPAPAALMDHPPPAPLTPAPSLTEMIHAGGSVMPGSVADLCVRLEELESIHQRGLINEAEFGAKKEQLLKRPFQPTSLGADLEQLGELRNRQVLSNAEYEAFKARILEIDN